MVFSDMLSLCNSVIRQAANDVMLALLLSCKSSAKNLTHSVRNFYLLPLHSSLKNVLTFLMLCVILYG